MSDSFANTVRPLTPGRWLLAGLLAGALFLMGSELNPIFAVLTQGWQVLLGMLGLAGPLAHLQQGSSHLVTTRSLPALATYGLLYVANCLLILHVLLRDGRRTRWAAQVYLGLLGLYLLLLVIGRLGGNIAWGYRLCRRFIDFVISPLPVMILLPVLWPNGRRPPGEKAAAQ